MTQYVDSTFLIHAPNDLELKKLLESLGYTKARVPLIEDAMKPIIPMSEPSSLKFYQNWIYSKNAKKNT